VTALSKASKLKSFLWLSGDDRRYLAWLKRQGAVDKRHYRETHRRLPAIFRAFPTRHYVAFGERVGVSPRPDFAPLSYARLNPEVRGLTELLRHYLEVGRLLGLRSFDDSDGSLDRQRTESQPKCSYAIVLHLYYFDLWPEFARVLEALDIDFDLYVSLTNSPDGMQQTRDAIAERFPRCSIITVPNRGRDFAPFIDLVGSGGLDGYRAVCKLHSKRSRHRGDGDRWRVGLIDGLLPGAGTGELLRSFLDDASALVASAPDQIRSDQKAWGTNRPKMADLLVRAGEHLDDRLQPFPAGSMFWIKPAAIDWLAALRLELSDFEPELGQLDGTTAHALERLVGYAAVCEGGQLHHTLALSRG